MARVLRPGGQVQIVGGTLDVFRRHHARRLRHGLRRLRDYWLTVGNTVCYERTGRRLWTPRGAAMTKAPIYPRPAYLDRWLEQAGLRPRVDLRQSIDVETFTVAEKP